MLETVLQRLQELLGIALGLVFHAVVEQRVGVLHRAGDAIELPGQGLQLIAGVGIVEPLGGRLGRPPIGQGIAAMQP